MRREGGKPELGAGSAPAEPGLGIRDSSASSRVPVSIRPATTADLQTVVALRMALLREHRRNPVYARLRRDAVTRAERLFAAQLSSEEEITFLAHRGETAVGILRCVAARGYPLLDPLRYAYVSSVYVTPAARRQGVLRALMREAERWSRKQGLSEIRLHSVAGHDDSNATWDALGFEVVELLRMRPLGAPADD